MAVLTAESQRRLSVLNETQTEINTNVDSSRILLEVFAQLGDLEYQYIRAMENGFNRIQSWIHNKPLNIFDDVKTFYSLRITNSRAFLQKLKQEIVNLDTFGVIAQNDLFNKMNQVKDDIGVIQEAAKMVDRAKRGYVNVRNKETAIELSEDHTEGEKKQMLEDLANDRKWAIEALDREAAEFNKFAEKSDENFAIFESNKTQFSSQLGLKAKKIFQELIKEYHRLNTSVFNSMKPSIDRIQEEIMANTEQCKAEAEGRKNGTPRKQRGSETATAATPEKDADEGKGAVVEEVVDDVVVVPDPTEEVEQPDEAAEPAEQEETPVEETRKEEATTRPNTDTQNNNNTDNQEEDGEEQPKEEEAAQDQQHQDQETFQQHQEHHQPRVNIKKIIEIVEKAIEDKKNGVLDDDALANEISSLKNQFKHITGGWRTKLGNFFSGGDRTTVDLTHFLSKVLEGANISGPQMEKLCKQFDQKKLRDATANFFKEYADDEISRASFTGIHVICKIFLMKCTPRHDWENLTKFLLAIFKIERNCGIRLKPGYVPLGDILKGHYLFAIEEFWVGCLEYLIKAQMDQSNKAYFNLAEAHDQILKFVMVRVLGRNKFIINYIFKSGNENAFDEICTEIFKRFDIIEETDTVETIKAEMKRFTEPAMELITLDLSA